MPQKVLAPYIEKGMVTLIKANFRYIKEELESRGVFGVDGILYDLGVSSPQLDQAERGFSYRHDAPLDMRMDQEQELTAQIIVNEWPYAELVKIFYRYGEEKFSKQIARRIESIREKDPIETTGELVEIIKDCIPAPARRKGGHPAKRIFQALRIAVNDELSAIEDSLEAGLAMLNEGGRMSVISFQSLEDRIVKMMFKEVSTVEDLPPMLPILPGEYEPDYKLITRKPISAERGRTERKFTFLERQVAHHRKNKKIAVTIFNRKERALWRYRNIGSQRLNRLCRMKGQNLKKQRLHPRR